MRDWPGDNVVYPPPPSCLLFAGVCVYVCVCVLWGVLNNMQPPSEVISRTFRAGRREGGGHWTQACLSGDTTSVKDCLYHKFVKQKQNLFCFFFCLKVLNSQVQQSST